MKIVEIIKNQIGKLREELDKHELALGEIIYFNGVCQILSQSSARYELIVSNELTDDVDEYALIIEDKGNIIPLEGNEPCGWDKNSFACLLQVESELHLLDPKEHVEHKKYTREGMIQRVLKERRQKADKAGLLDRLPHRTKFSKVINY